MIFLYSDYLFDTKKYLFFDNTTRECMISPNGWAYLDSLKQVNPESTTAFVAMSFDDSLDSFYSNSVKKAIENAGYESFRIKECHHNEMIDNEIIANIRKSKFMVADLTHQRPNVYFEAGYAKGMGIDVIWTCRQDEIDDKDKGIQFDTRQYAFTKWNADDLPSFTKDLTARIEATIGKINLT